MIIPVELDEQGQIVLDPTEREALGQVLTQVWPRETDVDAFLARRLECGAVPAAVVITVRAVRAAVRAVRTAASTSPSTEDHQ